MNALLRLTARVYHLRDGDETYAQWAAAGGAPDAGPAPDGGDACRPAPMNGDRADFGAIQLLTEGDYQVRVAFKRRGSFVGYGQSRVISVRKAPTLKSFAAEPNLLAPGERYKLSWELENYDVDKDGPIHIMIDDTEVESSTQASGEKWMDAPATPGSFEYAISVEPQAAAAIEHDRRAEVVSTPFRHEVRTAVSAYWEVERWNPYANHAVEITYAFTPANVLEAPSSGVLLARTTDWKTVMSSLTGRKLRRIVRTGGIGNDRDYAGNYLGSLPSTCLSGRCLLTVNYTLDPAAHQVQSVTIPVSISVVAISLEAQAIDGSVADDGNKRLTRGGRAFNLHWQIQSATDLSKVTSLTITGDVGGTAISPVDLMGAVGSAGGNLASGDESQTVTNENKGGASWSPGETDLAAKYTITCKAEGRTIAQSVEMTVLTSKPPLDFSDSRLSSDRQTLKGLIDQYVPAEYTNADGAKRNANGMALFQVAGWGPGDGARNQANHQTSCGDIVRAWLMLMAEAVGKSRADGPNRTGIRGFMVEAPARSRNLFIDSDGVKLPLPGDIFVLRQPAPNDDKQQHVAVVNAVSVTAGDTWETTDGGQGLLPNQSTLIGHPQCVTSDGQLFFFNGDPASGVGVKKRISGWVDFDRAMALIKA